MIPISEEFLKAATEWVDAEAAASLLEDTKSAVLSQMMLALGDMPVSKAELQVKASPQWMDTVTKIAKAREAANRAKVKVDYIKMRSSEWQSKEANERLMAKL